MPPLPVSSVTVPHVVSVPPFWASTVMTVSAPVAPWREQSKTSVSESARTELGDEGGEGAGREYGCHQSSGEPHGSFSCLRSGQHFWT